MSAGLGEGGAKLRPAIERVRALPRLNLDELGDDLEVLGLSETGDSGTLSFEAEA
jgi:hypothetical protein